MPAAMTNKPGMTDLYLTKSGIERLQAELKKLKEVDRKEVIAKIKEARAYGDLSENAEYHAARERQAVVEGRIEEIEAVLKKAKIITHKIDTTMVEIGSKVRVKVINANDSRKEAATEAFEMTIVGSTESDPLQGLISAESPLGAAILGSKKGDKVEVPVPEDGLMIYEILAIE